MHKDKFEKNSISVSVEVENTKEGTIIRTATIVKDKDIFPLLNVEDKKIMDGVLDVIVRQQQAILNTREFWLRPPKNPGGKMLSITCACGHTFEIEEPCCDKKQFDTICPKCGNKKTWRKQKGAKR